MNHFFGRGSYLGGASPDVADMKIVKKGIDIDPLLFDLLTTVSPSGKEDVIVPIIKKYIGWDKAFGKELCVQVDKKGNLYVRVGKPNTQKTMFSSHMDVVSAQARAGDTIDLRITKDKMVYASYNAVEKFYVDAEEKEVSSSTIGSYMRNKDNKGYEFRYHYFRIDSDKEYSIMRSQQPDGYNVFSIYETTDVFEGNWKQTDVKLVERTKERVKNSVLGADDKLGCYIMCKLIKAKVNGIYVFHVEEESGGNGSQYMVEEEPERFKDIDRCIAFDRYGYEDIITHQGGRTASDAFAKSFAKQINDYLPPKVNMKASPNGTFTDSANYASIIPECTNLSVGYKDQHRNNEHFDLEWLETHFLPALLKIKWDKLVTERNPYRESTRSTRWHPKSYYKSLDNRYAKLFEKANKKEETVFNNSFSKTKSISRGTQSKFDKARHLVQSLGDFDILDDFDHTLSQDQQIQSVLYSMLQSQMTFQDIAKLIVELQNKLLDNEEDDEYKEFNNWL